MYVVNPVLPADTVVTSIACGGYHSTCIMRYTYIHIYMYGTFFVFVSDIVLTEKNEVFTWGYGDMLVKAAL